MRGNRIRQLEDNSLGEVRNCWKLDLRENMLTGWSENAFKPMNDLQSLNLDYNKISFLNDSMFDHLQNIIEFMISYNHLYFINMKKTYHYLQIFVISNNHELEYVYINTTQTPLLEYIIIDKGFLCSCKVKQQLIPSLEKLSKFFHK